MKGLGLIIHQFWVSMSIAQPSKENIPRKQLIILRNYKVWTNVSGPFINIMYVLFCLAPGRDKKKGGVFLQILVQNHLIWYQIVWFGTESLYFFSMGRVKIRAQTAGAETAFAVRLRSKWNDEIVNLGKNMHMHMSNLQSRPARIYDVWGFPVVLWYFRKQVLHGFLLPWPYNN